MAIKKLQELKRQALAATPGEWQFGGYAGGILITAEGRDKHYPIATMNGDWTIPWHSTDESKLAFNDAAFIAAANPATILALIAQLEAQATPQQVASTIPIGGLVTLSAGQMVMLMGGMSVRNLGGADLVVSNSGQRIDVEPLASTSGVTDEQIISAWDEEFGVHDLEVADNEIIAFARTLLAAQPAPAGEYVTDSIELRMLTQHRRMKARGVRKGTMTADFDLPSSNDAQAAPAPTQLNATPVVTSTLNAESAVVGAELSGLPEPRKTVLVRRSVAGETYIEDLEPVHNYYTMPDLIAHGDECARKAGAGVAVGDKRIIEIAHECSRQPVPAEFTNAHPMSSGLLVFAHALLKEARLAAPPAVAQEGGKS